MNSNKTISRPPIDFAALARHESADAVVITSAGGEIVHWSEGAQRVFGYAPNEALGHTLQDLLVPLDRSDDEEALRARVQANGSATFETVLQRKDGALLQVDIASRVVDGAQPVALVFAVRDVTRLRVLRDGRLVETRFRELLESMPDGVVLVNASGHIVFANTQLAHLFGYPPQALQGRAVDELLPTRLRGNHFRPRGDAGARAKAHAAGRTWRLIDPLRERIRYTLELAGLRRDGGEFPIEISLSALQLDGSVMVMGAIRDISERRRVEDELRRKNIELEQANRAKDRFLATMSHELRTPLNAIIGFTGTLLMKLAGPLTADQERQLQTVQSSGRHLLSLINDLLDLARIESGKFELLLADTSCSAVVDEVAATLRPLADAKHLALRVERPADPVTLRSNERALNQILLNLVSNAIKFSEAGEVVIRMRESEVAPPPVLEISVTDTGPGIRKEDQPRLFQAFTRIEAGATRRNEGTGLGLYLSQKLADLLGGHITCESEPGRGSRFTLRLPVLH